jgi:predicted RND superfamily exporter protein
MKKSEPFLKILVISLGVVVLIYLTVSGWIAHVLSLVVVGVGVFFAIQLSNGTTV